MFVATDTVAEATVELVTASKSLPIESNERLRALVRELLETRAAGNITAFARELKVTGPYLNEFLSGKRGAGAKLLTALADYTGRTLDDLAGRKTVIALPPPPEGTALAGNLPHWAEASAEARSRKVVPDEAIAVAAHVGGLTAPKGGVTPEFVIDLAQFVARYGLHREEVREAADKERRAVERERKRSETMAAKGKKATRAK
jgi:transcriptional regulator with XRE-family HTH domain